MEIIIGLIIIAIGSFCQSSSYVPIKKVKEWSWESFWLIQGVFAWLVFPLSGALLGIPQGGSLFDLEKDPKELNNVASQHPDICEQLKAKLQEIRQRPETKADLVDLLPLDD